MKKLSGIIIVILALIVALVFTVPSREDFEEFIVEKAKEETKDDLLGLMDLAIDGLTTIIFATADYKDVKIGSTYAFSLGEDKDYKFVGFGTFIICVEGDLSILNNNTD